jgi:large subunit ribosomal protein L14
MIFIGSNLSVVDNSGAMKARCIGLYKRKWAKTGDVVVVTITKAAPNKKIKRKQIFRAVIVKTVHFDFGFSNFSKKFEKNGVVLLKKSDDQPIGNRITEPISLELRKNRKFVKFFSIAPKVIL